MEGRPRSGLGFQNQEGALMMILTWLAAALMATASAQNVLPVHDPEFGCIDQATAARYVNDFRINTRSFGGMELCRHEVDTKKLFNDLLLIENGRFPMLRNQNNLIRGFVPQDQYYAWLKSQTRGVSRGNDVPFATAYNRMGYFTMQDGWASLSTLGRVGVLIHEARHTAGYGHIRCVSGPYAQASTPGCDRDYGYGGSHGVEMEYYARVHVHGVNFHPVYKSMARLMAMARANFVFNTPVMRQTEALLAIEQNRSTPVLFHNGQSFVREAPQQRGWLKRTSFGAAIFTGPQAFSIEMYHRHGQRIDLPDVYSYFKLLDRVQAPFKDLEEYDVNGRRFVVGISGNDQVSVYDFPRGTWGASRQIPFRVARTATTLPTGQRGYFLIDESSRIYPFDAERGQVGAAMPQTWDPQVQAAAYDQNGRLVLLRTDNTLWNGSNPTRSPYLQGQWSNIVSVPLYDAFEVVP